MNWSIRKNICNMFFVCLTILILTSAVFSQENSSITGIWKGKFQLDFIFKIDENPQGYLSASFHIPHQEIFSVPVKEVRYINDSLYLNMEISNINKSSFTGFYEREKNIITGYYFDGIYKYPMTLESSPHLLAQMAPKVDEAGRRIETYKYQIPRQAEDDWQTGHLLSRGIDTSKISLVLNKILKEEYKKIHSMLIIKDGQLVLDEYFYGYSSSKKHFIASVTKSVVTLLTGIAIEKGMIKNIHEPLCTYFPEYSDILCTGEKKQISLYHLLSMSAGFEWDEQSYNYFDSRNSSVAMGNSNSGLQYLFERKLAAKPGEKYVYNSGLMVVLSEIIKKASGMPIDKFAEKYLFGPLGIGTYYWEKHKDGTFHAGGGLSILPRDMAKLGLLYMNKGEYHSKRIISGKWFYDCSARYLTGIGPEYWNHWSPKIEFINGVPVEIYSAGGLGGQFIYALPKLDVIVVFTSDLFGFPNQMNEIMSNYLLPAFIQSKKNTNKGNFTSKKIKILENYNWQYHWLSEMACIGAGLKAMDINYSPAWLHGSTGNAFIINIKNDLSVNSMTDAVKFINKPTKGIGFKTETIECSADSPSFSKKQEEAWNKIRQAIDKKNPCYGFQLDWASEYYMIFGYDDIGYLYKGIECFNGKGPKFWQDAGRNQSNKFIMKIMSPVEKADDSKLIKQALRFATSYYKNINHSDNFTAGPEAYSIWANALQNRNANGFGTALNAVTWAECRRHAVEYLKECKIKVKMENKALFDQAIVHFEVVSQKLNMIEQLFPFFISDEQKNANITNPDKCKQAVQLLLQAKKAETEGLKSISLILNNYN